MAIFKYQAMTLEGKVIKGRESAGDLRDLQSLLKGRDLKLIKGREVKERKSISFLTIGGGVKKSEVIIFIRQFAVMITAGINIIDAIDTMRFQVKSKVFRNILVKIYDDLLKGVYLSDAFAAHPKVFPSFLKNMIYIGEVSGNLDYVLNKVADYYERDLKTKAKAKNALTYPTFLFVIIVAVFIFLTVYIVPEFQNMLKEFGGELPYLTQIVFNISNFMRGNFINILQYVGCAFVFLWIFFKTKPGRYVKDYLKLNLPFLRAINHTLITARFARGLGILIGSGVHVMDSIEIIGRLMDNKVFEQKFKYAISEVKRGKRIARSIDNINFFPKMLVKMILVGETTGSLEMVLEKTADYYDDQLERTITRVTSILEPLMIITAGAVIGIVILSIFLPMMSLLDSISGEDVYGS